MDNFRKWIVIDTADADSVNWRDPYMITSNASTAQKSIDETKMLISYNEVLPNSITSIASKGSELDRSAVQTLLASDDWHVEEVL